MSLGDPLHNGPDEPARCRCQHCRCESIRRDRVRPEGRTGIKAKPAHVEHSRSDHAKHHRVWRHRLLSKTAPRAEEKAQYEGGPPRGHMKNNATRKTNG